MLSRLQTISAERKLVCLTAYTTSMAKCLDPLCDMILVGDSVAMTIYGHISTQHADLAMMARHGAAVRRGTKNAMMVVDMPAGSYETSPEQALKSARYLLDETGADALKLEGGGKIMEAIQCLIAHDIPIIGHIGLLPQTFGEGQPYKVAGRGEDEKAELLHEATLHRQAGVKAVVLEAIVEPVARQIVAESGLICIGIGASLACHGQILVVDDLIGLYDGAMPKFAKKYADSRDVIGAAVRAWRDDVIGENFPGPKNLYHK